MDRCLYGFYLQDHVTLSTRSHYAFCSSINLVSRVTSLVSAIAKITALVPSVARVTPALVLLIIVVGGIVLSVTLHLLAVIEVLAFGLDEPIGFGACEAGKEVFGYGMIFGDTCTRQGYVRTKITWSKRPKMDACKRKEKRIFPKGVGQPTVGFLVLLILSHGFEACSTSEEFVTEAGLVVRLRTVLSIDILVGL